MVYDWWISIRFVSFCISSHVIVIMIDGSHSRPLATRLNYNDHVTKNRRALGTRIDGSEERIRPFPSSKKSHFQSEAKCEAIDMEMIFNYDANKIIFTTKISHLAWFWKWDFMEQPRPQGFPLKGKALGTRLFMELGNGLWRRLLYFRVYVFLKSAVSLTLRTFAFLYTENVKAFKTSSLYKNAKASNVPWIECLSPLFMFIFDQQQPSQALDRGARK